MAYRFVVVAIHTGGRFGAETLTAVCAGWATLSGAGPVPSRVCVALQRPTQRSRRETQLQTQYGFGRQWFRVSCMGSTCEPRDLMRLPGPRSWRGMNHGPAHARARHLRTLFADVGPTSRAVLLSQGGDAAGCAFTAIPSSPEHGGASCGILKVLLLRKLRLPPQLARACGGLLDDFGDHRPACAQAGVLVRQEGLLERAAVRICKEARARMATNDVVYGIESRCARAQERSSPTVSVFGRAPKSRLMRRLLAQSDVTAVHARDPTARPASPLTRKHTPNVLGHSVGGFCANTRGPGFQFPASPAMVCFCKYASCSIFQFQP